MEVTRQHKTFVATSRLTGGVIRVVIVRFEDGGWAPYFCTSEAATAREILEAVADRWAIEEYFIQSKKRVVIPFDDELVARTPQLLAEFRATAADTYVPPPLVDSPKCPRCSLVGICLPDEVVFLQAGGGERNEESRKEKGERRKEKGERRSCCAVSVDHQRSTKPVLRQHKRRPRR